MGGGGRHKNSIGKYQGTHMNRGESIWEVGMCLRCVVWRYEGDKGTGDMGMCM